MASTTIGGASYQVGADLTPLDKDLKSAEAKFKQSGQAIDQAYGKQGTAAVGKLAKAQQVLLGQSGELKKSVLTGVGLGAGAVGVMAVAKGFQMVSGFIGDSIGEAKAFQAQLGTINTVAGLSGRKLGELGIGIQDMAIKSAKSTGELTDAFYNLVSAGVAAEDAMGVLEHSTNLATGALSTTNEAVDLLTTTLNAFKVDASESGRIVDVWSKTVANGKITASQLASSIAQVAPIAAATGVSIQEVAAAYATMTAQGTPASQAATQMKAAITALLKPNAELAKLQAELGDTTFEQMLANEGLAATLQAVSDAAGGNTATITKALGSTEAYNATLQLTGGSAEAFTKNLRDMNSAWEDGGAAVRMAGERMDTLAFRQEQLGAKNQVLMQKLGAALLPVMEGITTVAGTAVDAVLGLADGIDKLVTAASDFLDSGRLVTGEMEKLADRVPYAGQAFLDWADATEKARRAAELTAQWQTRLSEQTALSGAEAEIWGSNIGLALQQTGLDADEAAARVNDWVVSMNAGLPTSDQYAERTAYLASMFAALQADLGTSIGSLDQMQAGLQGTSTAADEAAASLETFLATPEGAAAYDAWRASLSDLPGDLAQVKLWLAETSVVTTDLSFRTRKAAADMMALDGASVVATGSLKELRTGIKGADDAWKDLIKAGDRNKRAIKELTEEIDKWEKRYKRAIKNNDSEAAAYAAERLKELEAEKAEREEVAAATAEQHKELTKVNAELAKLPKDKTVNVDIVARYHDFALYNRAIAGTTPGGGHQSGGPVYPGVYQVNERGREMLITGGRGYILDAANTTAATSGQKQRVDHYHHIDAQSARNLSDAGIADAERVALLLRSSVNGAGTRYRWAG